MRVRARATRLTVRGVGSGGDFLHIFLLAFLALLLASCAAPFVDSERPSFDLMINDGRALDPASALDGMRSLGIVGGRIAAISQEPLSGARTIDATEKVVGPGFIDYHAHGGTLLSGRLQAFDGVTTAIEAEVGQLPIPDAYALAAKQGRATNYGWTASWGLARMNVLAGGSVDGTIDGFLRGTH